MPQPRQNINAGFGGNRAPGRGRFVNDFGGIAKPKKRRKDRNVDREGYGPCDVCKYWIRLRTDGTVRAHATDGAAMSIKKVPCLGGVPRVS